MIVEANADRHVYAGRTNGQGKDIHLVDDLPRDAADAALGWVSELIEGVGREVEVAVGASLAPVSQLDIDGLALVGNLGSLVAHGILVRVAAGVIREGIKEQVRDGGDVLTIVVGNTASTETGGVERSLTGVGVSSPVTRIRSGSRGRSRLGGGRIRLLGSRRIRLLGSRGRRLRVLLGRGASGPVVLLVHPRGRLR